MPFSYWINVLGQSSLKVSMAQGNGVAQPNKVGNIAHYILLLVENAPYKLKALLSPSVTSVK